MIYLTYNENKYTKTIDEESIAKILIYYLITFGDSFSHIIIDSIHLKNVIQDQKQYKDIRSVK